MGAVDASARLESIGYSLGIVVAGLTGRAVIDKLLAAQGGGEAVALWAQLQSVVEMVAGIVGIGIGQGLTVLVAQQADAGRRRILLLAALMLGATVGGVVATFVVGAMLFDLGPVRDWFPDRQGLAALSALAGWFGVASGVVCASWLGRHRQDLVFWLVVALTLVPVGAALAGHPPAGLLAAQTMVGSLVAISVTALLVRRVGDRAAIAALTAFAPGGIARPLLSYVPVGVAISLASPVALILIRGEVSTVLSWHDAGRLQAIWRAADWVTAIMSGLLALVVLPRLSAAVADGPAAFRTVLRRAALHALWPTAALLLALWMALREVLVALYDERFMVDPAVAGVFFLGDLLRVASWVILFALLARRATVWVTVGEFLSMPLFAAFVLIFSSGMSLQRAAGLYLLTYAIYLAFNLAGLRSMMKGFR